MADKLILSANMVCKADNFNPEKIAVEKVIELPGAEFKRFIEKPLERNYYLSTYKELSGFYDDIYHGVLFVNSQSGDGLLVNSEGADYARYSQFIPNARVLIKTHEQSAAFDDLKETIKCAVNEWLSEHNNDAEPCVSIEEFIENSGIYKSIEECVEDGFLKNPIVEKCGMQTGFIEVEIKPIMTTKYYSPIAVVTCDPEDYSEDMVDVDSRVLLNYADTINARIIKATPHNYCRADAPSDFSSDCTNFTQAGCRLSRKICAI